MTPPLQVDFKPSLGAAMVLFALHVAAAAGASILLPVPAALLVTAGLILAACSSAALAWSAQRRAVGSLKIDSDGAAHLQTRTGEWCAARLTHVGLLTPFSLALLFRDESGRLHPVMAIRAAGSADAMRRLRVWAVNDSGFSSTRRDADPRSFA